MIFAYLLSYKKGWGAFIWLSDHIQAFAASFLTSVRLTLDHTGEGGRKVFRSAAAQIRPIDT